MPGEEEQAEDRIHRRGQERQVAYYYLIAPGTIDDAMGELVTWKERVREQSLEVKKRYDCSL